MIFVTVGTHEQQFNRLIEYIDKMVEKEIIKEDVIIQTGYSTYEPQNCKYQKLFSYNEMLKFVRNARIVITHGGPSSFIMPLQIGKIPIVVPRQYKFNEHVNDHQVKFTQEVSERMGNIILVQDVTDLDKVIINYETITENMKKTNYSNNILFNKRLEEIVLNMCGDN